MVTTGSYDRRVDAVSRRCAVSSRPTAASGKLMYLQVSVTKDNVQSSAREDGRRSRWSAHREQRRAVLVEAAVQAVLRHGADADMARVAAVAGVSKPVLYRYFADKAELWLAVGEHVARL